MELQIRGVSKTYPYGVHALKDVTLAIPTGKYGLLGPNGLGQSTLMRMIATLQDPDAGTIHLRDPLKGSGQAINVVNQKDEVRKTRASDVTVVRFDNRPIRKNVSQTGTNNLMVIGDQTLHARIQVVRWSPVYIFTILS